jgi:hypothetical protein
MELPLTISCYLYFPPLGFDNIHEHFRCPVSQHIVKVAVVCGQEVGVTVLILNAEDLICGDRDTGVLGIVDAVRFAVRFSRVGTKDILEGFEGLRAKFVAVTDEQGAGELPGIGYSLEQVDGAVWRPAIQACNPCLALIGCEAQPGKEMRQSVSVQRLTQRSNRTRRTDGRWT